MKKRNELYPRLEKQLDRLKAVPERDPGVAARGRARFLAEASSLRPRVPAKRNQVVSRRLAWQFALVSLVVVGLLFGGSVGAVSAAQQSLPGQSLYPFKLVGEDVRLALITGSQAEIDLLIQLIAVRVDEMNQLAAQDAAIPVQTTERLDSHVHQALYLAAGLDDDGMQAAMSRIRLCLQEQNQILQQVGGDAGELLLPVRQMLQARLQFLDEGLVDPGTFRQRMQFGQEDGYPGLPPYTSGTPAPGGEGGGGSTPGGPDQDPGHGKDPAKTPGPTGIPGSPAGTGIPNNSGGGNPGHGNP